MSLALQSEPRVSRRCRSSAVDISPAEWSELSALVQQEHPDSGVNPDLFLRLVIGGIQESDRPHLPETISVGYLRTAVFAETGELKSEAALHEGDDEQERRDDAENEAVELNPDVHSDPSFSSLHSKETVDHLTFVRDCFDIPFLDGIDLVLVDTITCLAEQYPILAQGSDSPFQDFCLHLHDHWEDTHDFHRLLLFRSLVQHFVSFPLEEDCLELLRLEINLHVLLFFVDRPDLQTPYYCISLTRDFLMAFDDWLKARNFQQSQVFSATVLTDLLHEFSDSEEGGDVTSVLLAVIERRDEVAVRSGAAAAYKRRSISDARTQFLFQERARPSESVHRFQRRNPDLSSSERRPRTNEVPTLREYEAVIAYRCNESNNQVRGLLDMPLLEEGVRQDRELALRIRKIIDKTLFCLKGVLPARRERTERRAVTEDHKLAVQEHDQQLISDAEFLSRLSLKPDADIQSAKKAIRAMFPELSTRVMLSDSEKIQIARRYWLGYPHPIRQSRIRSLVYGITQAAPEAFVGYPTKRLSTPMTLEEWWASQQDSPAEMALT